MKGGLNEQVPKLESLEGGEVPKLESLEDGKLEVWRSRMTKRTKPSLESPSWPGSWSRTHETGWLGFGVGGLDPWWGVLGLQVLEGTVMSRTGSLARDDASPLP